MGLISPTGDLPWKIIFLLTSQTLYEDRSVANYHARPLIMSTYFPYTNQPYNKWKYTNILIVESFVGGDGEAFLVLSPSILIFIREIFFYLFLQ